MPPHATPQRPTAPLRATPLLPPRPPPCCSHHAHPLMEDSEAMDDLTRLAIAAGSGDRVALAAFVRTSQAEVWRLCRHLAGPGAADDVTQDAYARAIPALAGFRAEATARTWLLGIARRAAADHVRREQR